MIKSATQKEESSNRESHSTKSVNRITCRVKLQWQSVQRLTLLIANLQFDNIWLDLLLIIRFFLKQPSFLIFFGKKSASKK